MDDIIDMEIEKIDRILEKVTHDPEEEGFKRTEGELWEKIKKTCAEGRRTGVGITAEGDMLAALGLRYGTKKAIDYSIKVHQALALAAYRCSVETISGSINKDPIKNPIAPNNVKNMDR